MALADASVLADRLAAALADPAAGKARAERAAAFVEARDAEARAGLTRIIELVP